MTEGKHDNGFNKIFIPPTDLDEDGRVKSLTLSVDEAPPGFEPVNGMQLSIYWEKLKNNLRSLKGPQGITLAYSGGLDSRVLLHLCLELGLEVEALHFSGPQFASDHSCEAVTWLANNNIPHQVVEHNPLSIPEVRRGHPKRCYFCKKSSLERLKEIAGARVLCDGTNFSDFRQYRPGLTALRELGVISPFASVRMTKAMIRRMAQIMNLEVQRKNYQNCLLTRFEYGLTVHEQQLATIEKVEAAVKPLLTPYNFFGEAQDPLEYRLRYLADPTTIRGYRAELHIKTAHSLPEVLYASLYKVLLQHDLSDANIYTMPEISGFFDRNLGFGNNA